jgi:hypothetical protein
LSAKIKINFDPGARPVYTHLDPIVELLLRSGNRLARDYRWGENRTGFFCFFAGPIDFDLIEQTLELPSFVRLDREHDVIECDRTWASIKGGM